MRLSVPTTKKWMKIDPYYQQQKCRPLTLVSGDIKFVRIFAGVLWRGASNDRGVIENVDFHGFWTLRLRHLRKWDQHYYTVYSTGEKWPLPRDIQKQKSFQLQGGFAPLIPWPGALPLDPAGGSAPRPPNVPPAPNLPLHHWKYACEAFSHTKCDSNHFLRPGLFSIGYTRV